MKTKEQILKMLKDGTLRSQCIDGRDFIRLSDFFEPEHYNLLGFELNEGVNIEELPPTKQWLIEEFIIQLKADVAFGFEKALGQRGISSDLMFETVRLWLFILEDALWEDAPGENRDEYMWYGLPLFKKVATKYGFENPIGIDQGNELRYEG